MEPAEYLAALRKHWLLIAVLAAVGLAAGYLWSDRIPPSYRATASVYVTVPQSASVGELVQGSNYAQARIGSYAQLATKPYVLDRVIEQLELDTTSRKLAGRISASTPLDTVILEISALDGDPEQAAAIADAVSAQLAAAVDQLEGAGTEEAPNVQITLVAAADVPVHPVAPNKRLDAATGMALGGVLGVVAALARVLLDTRIRSVRDVRRVTGAPVLSMIRYDRRGRTNRLVVQEEPFGDRAEAYRRLRTNLRFLTVAGPSRAFVVTSALPGEGKTTAAVNLATAMAETGTRVLLIDADLRRPAVATYLGIEGGAGLTTALIGEVPATEVVQRWGSRLDVLPAGQIPPNPSELLDSRAMGSVLAQLAQRYDVILLDCAPLLPVTDAAALARMTDGALLVVGCRTVRRHHVAEALNGLETVGARILGLVLNQVAARESLSVGTYGSTPRATERSWSARNAAQAQGTRRTGWRRRPPEARAPVAQTTATPPPAPEAVAPARSASPAAPPAASARVTYLPAEPPPVTGSWNRRAAGVDPWPNDGRPAGVGAHEVDDVSTVRTYGAAGVYGAGPDPFGHRHTDPDAETATRNESGRPARPGASGPDHQVPVTRHEPGPGGADDGGHAAGGTTRATS